MPNETELNPAEQKRQAIIDAACELFRDLFASHVDEATTDANEAFQRDDGETAPVVKLAFTLDFKPLDESPEVKLRVAWSVKRTDEATKKVDSSQGKLEFEGTNAPALK